VEPDAPLPETGDVFAPGSSVPDALPGEIDMWLAALEAASGSRAVAGSCVGLEAPGFVDGAAGFVAGRCELGLPGALACFPFPRCSMYTLFDMLFCV
jgi:hypothetical protein